MRMSHTYVGHGHYVGDDLDNNICCYAMLIMREVVGRYNDMRLNAMM
jgi:hypothetical protein